MRPQDRLREALTEANALATKGVLDKTESAKLEALLYETDGLKSQIDSLGKLGRLYVWAGESAGSLPLAGPDAPAQMIGAKYAGETVIRGVEPDRLYRGGIELLDQYGEGILSSANLQKVSTPEYRGAFKSYLRGRPDYNGLKVLQEGADSAGGFLVPADILDRVISRTPTPTRIAGRVTQLQTSRDQLIIPKVVYSTDNLYTTGMRVTWTGEVPVSATTHRVTDPVFGQVSVPVYTAMMSIAVTKDMIEDASFPLVSYVSGKFGETIELLRDNMIINGTGLGQPAGILLNPYGGSNTDTNQPTRLASGSSTTITANGLVAMGFALPEQYDDNACWVMNKTSTAAALAQLTDSVTGRYLWGVGMQDSGLAAGWKNRDLLGYPVVLSGFMPDIAGSAYPIIFGDLSGYYLVNRVGFSVQVLQELYAETNQVLLLGRIRFGGVTAEPWKLKAMLIATTVP